MKIIAGIKATPEVEDIETNADRTLSFDRAAWKIGTYDLNAVEAARQLVDEVGGEVVGVSVGGSALSGSKLRKDVISRGLDELVVLADDSFVSADSYQSAGLLKDAVTQIGDFDLVLLGAGSSDIYAQQVGNQLGVLLDVPVLNGVNKITASGDKLVVERLLEDVVQVVEVTLPAVLSVTSGINTPRIAGMKDILAAGKKPTTELDAAAAAGNIAAPSTRVVSTLAPESVARQQQILEGDAAEVAGKLADYLKAL